MHADQTLNLEAAKLIKDWSSWMVAVQSGLLVAVTKYGAESLGMKASPESVNIAIVCFVVSILSAAWVLSALPFVVINLSQTKSPNLYELPLSSFFILRHIPLSWMLAVQHWSFGLGICALLIGHFLQVSR